MHVRHAVGMVALSLLGMAFAPVPPPKDPAKTPAGLARKQLEGKWVIKFLETPNPAPRNGLTFRVGSNVRINGETWTFNYQQGLRPRSGDLEDFDDRGRNRAGRRKGKGSRNDFLLFVDPRRNPTTLELKRGRNEIALKAVYQLEGNVLHLCFVSGEAELPSQLKPRPEDACLVILERIQP